MSPFFVGPANGGRKIYGPLSSAPSSGLTDGDEYYNTTEHQKYIYSGATNAFVKIDHPRVGIDIGDPFNDNSAIAAFNLDGNATTLSGTIYTGTLAGDNSSGNFYSGGKFGQLWRGTGSTHLRSASSSIIPSGSHSLSFWYKSNTTNQNNKRLMTVKGTSLTSGWSNYNGSIGFFTGPGQSAVGTAGVVTRKASIPDAAVNNNVWHHLAYTISAQNIWTIYLDGSVYNNPYSGSTESRSFNNSSYFAITTYENSTGYNTTGDIDQVRLFNRVLTAAEITALYNET